VREKWVSRVEKYQGKGKGGVGLSYETTVDHGEVGPYLLRARRGKRYSPPLTFRSAIPQGLGTVKITLYKTWNYGVGGARKEE